MGIMYDDNYDPDSFEYSCLAGILYLAALLGFSVFVVWFFLVAMAPPGGW